MGAFGSCLGVGRPQRPGANPRLLASNLVNGDPSNPFGPLTSNSGRQMMRPPLNSTSRQQHAFLSNGLLSSTGANKGGCPLPKLLRQSSSLSNGQTHQQQTSQQLPFTNHQSPSQTVPKLVDIDDNSMSSGFDAIKPLQQQQQQQSSHLICNNNNNITNKQSAGLNANSVLMNDDLENFIKDPNDIRVFVAMFDYEPRTNDDLGFRKGDHLITTTSYMSGDWWLAKSKATKKFGYIPSNYVNELKCSLDSEPWYLGKIGRTEAENRLQMPENKDGAFIIRDSDTTNSHQYSLSLKHDNHVKHYRIYEGEKGGYYINKRTELSTIHDLVVHYSKSADGLCINLREPCVSRFERPPTKGLSYDTCDRWEIDRNRLTLLHELGRGQFGQVFEGLFEGKTRVAIKTLRKGSMDTKDFLGEANIMKNMHHENLVKLYFVCTKEEPIYIITELMSKGALISYLQTMEGKSLPLKEYIKMATQIAAGMSYIEEKSYVHRDLAARNILVGDNNVCKIADFGLARFLKETEYEAKAGARFPIKWTAPEAANHSIFTIKSDVWSFGIVLYEIITKGGTPYPDMTNADVLDRIEKGYRMPQPQNCESKYYGIMVECWNMDPKKRPTFETLLWKLSGYFDPEEQYKEASLVNGSQFSKR